MLLETFPVGLLACNCSLLGDPSTGRAVVIDPGADAEEILARIDKLHLKIESILHTHAHIDHVGATCALQRQTGAPARMHPDDAFMIDVLGVQAAMIGLPMPPVADFLLDLEDGGTVEVGELKLEVIHTPGHSPGCVSFLVRHGMGQWLFSGDTLFHRGIGRTDLWGGDSRRIVRSIRERLYCLDPGVVVIPGHGPGTSIGEEKESNPHVRVGRSAMK